jgi:hypothetical protein
MTRIAYGKAILLFLAIATIAAAARSVEPRGVGVGGKEERDPSVVEAAPRQQRVWFEPGPGHSNDQMVLTVVYPELVEAGEDAILETETISDEAADNVQLCLSILDASGRLLYEGERTFAAQPGVNLLRFVWPTAGLGEGRYKARFEVIRPINRLMARQDIEVRVLSYARLEERIAEHQAALAAMADHVGSHREGATASPYVALRLNIAEDFLPMASGSLLSGDWRLADSICAYVADALDAIGALLAFMSVTPEFAEPVPQADLAAIQTRDGLFFAGGRPIYLFGAAPSAYLNSDVARLRRYGLHLASVSLGPVPPAADPSEVVRARSVQLDRFFEEARKHNIRVAAHLGLALTGEELLAYSPGLAFSYEGTYYLDLPSDEVLAMLGRQIRETAGYVAKQPMLHSIALVDDPAFHFSGETFRRAFVSHVREGYPDRFTLNNAWKTRLRSYDDIEVDWAYHRPAYQYDIQTCQMKLASAFLNWMKSEVRAVAPETPLQLEFSEDLLEKGETRKGVDHRFLGRTVDISGCAVSTELKDERYAMAYPSQSLLYALLRSLAPGQPLMNLEHHMIDGADRYAPYSFEYVHSVLWDGVMSGLNASAVSGWDMTDSGPFRYGILKRPACLEGYATAALDINRLAAIVAAFQQAPASVEILWSLPSRIYDDGDPYLASVKTAFEGLSFGGCKVGFLSEDRCAKGGLEGVELLAIPNTPAISDEAFSAIEEYIKGGGGVVRADMAGPYTAQGSVRHTVLPQTMQTILIHGGELPNNYLDAMDAAYARGLLTPAPRAINAFGYPLEGVKTLSVQHAGNTYVYLLNIRQEPVVCHMAGAAQRGRDLIGARDITFPHRVQPLDPMLIRLSDPAFPAPEEEPLTQEEETPLVPVEPVSAETP